MIAAALSARLPEWISSIEAGGRLDAVFFRSMTLPAGPVSARRPPRETRPELTTLISASPSEADLYSLRARETELMLDHSAAEADWKKYAELAGDKPEGFTALADYYHRQLKVSPELEALSSAAAQPNSPSERFTPADRQRSWNLFQRMIALSRKQLLARDVCEGIYRQWRDRYPEAPQPPKDWIAYLISEKQYARAESLAAEYAQRFPGDVHTTVQVRARIERARNGPDSALAVYDKEFQPLWPPPLINEMFAAMKQARQSRRFLTAARASAAANPTAIDPAARIFHFYLQEGNPGAAHRALHDFRRRKEATPNNWKPDELLTMARLWDAFAQVPDESLRYYYALYSAPGASEPRQEEALASILSLLLIQPDRIGSFGTGNLSIYRDIATADSHPGYLNGILSLLLNSSEPQYRFSTQEQAATPYFKRARAADLLAIFERRFPSSNRRAALRAQLIQAFAIHGDSDAVIRAGGQYLSAFPNDGSRTTVALLVADAHARKGQTPQELAQYDTLLAELARKAEGVPLGDGAVVRTQPAGPSRGQTGARSPDYARVLDRYVARLAALKRTQDALTVLRRELDRNPDDPGLYERLVQFLDQNKIAAEIESVYRKAIERFPDRSWHHKLARFYLRRKQTAEFRQLTTDVTKIFAGSELERYFAGVVAQGGLDSQMLRQVNLAAHQRFPRNLVFVNNLLNVYQRRETSNPAEWERLLRQYWFHEDTLRARFFEFLSRSGKLRAEIQALRASSNAANPAARQMLAEAEAWRGHFEEAAPNLSALARETPGEAATGVRAAALLRSLAAYDFRRAVDSIAFETALARFAPRDSTALTRTGEIYADSNRFALAKPIWQRITEIEPGTPDGYLESATLFWDYFQFDDALGMITAGRRRLDQPSIHAYEAGAIHENKRDYPRALEEYVRGSLAQPGGSPAQSRLLALARRPSLRAAIDAATANLVGSDSPDMNGVALRIALLENQQRKGDIEALMLNLADRAQSFEALTRLEEESRRLAMPAVEERSLLRQIALTQDPVDRLKGRLALARHYENQRNAAAAARTIDALVRENPQTLGVVRAAVDYHWRSRNVSRTLELLNAAATRAHADWKPHLQFEAARKATEGGQYAAARGILTELLKTSPEDASYISAMADTYAREGDDRALRAFYVGKVSAIPRDRVAQAASLRRSLIPVLHRMKDFAGAVDQYIEVLNRYLEDPALADELAAYARANQLQARVRDYYTKASASSPRDARLHAVLARIHTSFEDYPAAINAYTKAVELRPDRTDLLTARANLEERLLRFDEAAATFTRIYDLSYRNSVWMERVAEIRARQRRTGDCLAALRKAFTEGREDSPGGYFAAAEKLERWDMLPQAREFAEEALKRAGAKAVEEYPSGTETYVRIMVRLGQFAAAHAKLPSMLDRMATEVGMRSTLARKTEFAAFLDTIQPAPDPETGARAGLAEWEAKRLLQTMLAEPDSPESQQRMERLRQLQRDRLAFVDLGSQLEAYWKAHPPGDARQVIAQHAAEAYRLAGDDIRELRALALTNGYSDRRLELMAKNLPAPLVQLAASSRRYDVVQAAVDHAGPVIALQAIAARGRTLPPVWTSAYTSLAGLYFGLRTPNITQAFQTVLGTMMIADRAGKPVNRDQQLAGDVWFYYGSRYAEYLDGARNREAEDFLAAEIESRPGNADAYYTLAEYERLSGRAAAALADYGHALQLNPAHGGALIKRGVAQAAQGNMTAARASWKEALDAIAAQLDQLRVPGQTSGDLRTLVDELASRKLLAELRPEVELCVTRHVQRFGTHGVRGILKHFDAAAIVAMSRRLSDPAEFLLPFTEDPATPPAGKTLYFERIIEWSAQRLAPAVGEQRDMAANQHWQSFARYLEHLVDTGQVTRAKSTADSLSDEGRQRLGYLLKPLEIRVAAREGRLPQLIESWKGDAAKAPSNVEIEQVAASLRENGGAVEARQLLRYHYERELTHGHAASSYYLGLAGIFLEEGDTASAVALLRRLNLIVEPAFSELKNSARLLTQHNRTAEAREFRDAAAKAIPWDVDPPAEAQSALPATLAPAVAAVRADPTDEKAKLQLFRLAFSAGQHRTAISAMRALNERTGLRRFFEIGIAADDNPERYISAQFLSLFALPAAERAKLARDAADSMERGGLLGGAIGMRQVAAMIQSTPADAAWIVERRREFDRIEENRRRRPRITENPHQDGIVMPMIARGGAR